MLGAGPVATEALKSLVLGGIASFTIVDSELLSDRDLGNNFFCNEANKGMGRAEAATQLLRELNESVSGSFSDSNVHDLIKSNTAFFKGFSIVIATQMRRHTAKQLDNICRKHGVPLILLRSHGPFGTLQVSGPEMCIIESKPDNVVPDLRLVHPWPELQAFADSIDLATCDDIVHKHTPYALLLIKAINAWRGEHSQPPATAAERREFKSLIQGWQRSVEGMPIEEENFQEALRAAHTAWALPSVPSSTQALFDDPAVHLTRDSSLFWVLVAALKSFVENEGSGALPLEGSVPDMTATTQLYLQLQRMYRARSDEHCAAVLSHAQRLLTGLGRGATEAQPDVVKAFCKNARSLRVVRPKPVAACAADLAADSLRQHLDGQEPCNEAAIYLCLHASDQFYEQHGRLPGEAQEITNAAWENDIGHFRQIVLAVAHEVGLPAGCVAEEVMVEFCRCVSADLHCVAAIMGGIASQEAIKVLVRQFVPVKGVLVFNGIRAATSVIDI